MNKIIQKCFLFIFCGISAYISAQDKNLFANLNINKNDSGVLVFKPNTYCVLYAKKAKVNRFRFAFAGGGIIKIDTTIRKNGNKSILIKALTESAPAIKIFLNAKGRIVFAEYSENDKLNGHSYIFDKKGNLKFVDNDSINGKQGEQFFFKKGKIARVERIDQTRNPKTVYIKTFYSSGRIRSHLRFTSTGRIEERFFKNGNLSEVRVLNASGSLDGTQKKFNKKGKCVSEKCYSNGRVVVMPS